MFMKPEIKMQIPPKTFERDARKELEKHILLIYSGKEFPTNGRIYIASVPFPRIRRIYFTSVMFFYNS